MHCICIVLEYLYSASLSHHKALQKRFQYDWLPENRQVLKGAREVEKLEERKELLEAGGK